MFESDQHEFDEEYAEVSHPAPPLPPKPPELRGACRGGTVQGGRRPRADRGRPEEEQYDESEEAEQEEFVDPAEKPAVAPPPKKKPPVLLLGGFAALIVFAIFVVMTMNKPKDDTPQPGDLGPGIVAVAGLRGHLETRWDGNAKTGRLVVQTADRADGGSLGRRVLARGKQSAAADVGEYSTAGFDGICVVRKGN